MFGGMGMKVDIRVSDLSRLDEVLRLPIDCVGIGSEGCPHKLPGIEAVREASKKVRAAGKSLRLITPKVPQIDFAEVIELLRQIIGEPLVDAFTFNDFGVLDTLRDELRPFSIDVGRELIFSHDVAPGLWEDKHGDPMVFEFNVGFREKIEFMQSLGIGGVEMNYLPRALPGTLDFLKAHRFRRSVHLVYQMIAVSRSCHVARNFHLDRNECAGRCDELLKLEVNQMIHMHNQTSDQRYSEPDEFNRALPFYVQGNIVFIKQPVISLEPVFDLDIETVILNDAGLRWSELNEWVLLVKGGGYSASDEGEGACALVGCSKTDY
jgi:hypothetical protein